MTWAEINTFLVVAAIVAIIVRLVVVAGYGYGAGDSLLLTFYLPTGALLLVMIRVFLAPFVEGFGPRDGVGAVVGAVVWALLLVTQGVAAIQSWRPRSGGPAVEVPVHDATVVDRLDRLSEQITALPDPTPPGIVGSDAEPDADVPVHDAKLMARIDVMSDRVTATGDAVDALTEEHKS